MFEKIKIFEQKISEFFNSPYAVATDSCTHALELCLRYTGVDMITIPTNTYVSVPMTLIKLGLQWNWKKENWREYYYLGNTSIIDAAVLWRENAYIPNTFMCLSFQHKKHLGLGRGGIILLDKKEDYDILKKMSYDGRDFERPWAEQNINIMGYHYYMTPETAQLGIDLLPERKNIPSKQWSYIDYPYLPKMPIFNS